MARRLGARCPSYFRSGSTLHLGNILAFSFVVLKTKGRHMPKGREKDRELRRKHRKNQDRMKALEKTQRQSGKKK